MSIAFEGQVVWAYAITGAEAGYALSISIFLMKVFDGTGHILFS